MNLLLTFDDAYTPHAGVTLFSFLTNNPGSHSVYVITDRLSESNRQLIEKICAPSATQVHYYCVEEVDTRDFPVGKGTQNPGLSIAAYYRLFATRLLPQAVEKVLYLDCDLIVDGSLEELWNTSFQKGNCVAAVEELPKLAADGCRRMGYPLSYSYFNSGVLLIDMERLRQVYSVEKASDFIRKHHSEIIYHDQDVLNALLYDKKQFLDLRYNVIDTYFIKNAVFPHRYQFQRDALLHPKVIHFTGPFKPWHTECTHPYVFKYEAYQAQTPWRHALRKRKLPVLNEGVFYLKRIAKVLLEALHIRQYSYISLPQERPIVINGRFLTQPMTGVHRYAYEHSRLLLQNKKSVVIVCPHGALCADYNINGLPIRRFGYGRSHVWAQLVLPWYFLFRPQHQLVCYMGLAPLLVRHVTMTIHDLSFLFNKHWYSRAYYWFYRIMTPICARHAEQIITVSNTSRQDILSHYPFLQFKQIQVIPPIVNRAYFCPSNEKRERFVLAVATRDPRKNLTTLIEAVGAAPDVHLKIVGGANRVFASSETKSYANIEWLGRVTDAELLSLYRKAAVFVYPSLFEGYGIPPVEAMSCGCAVAVSDIPIMHEVCDGREEGRVVYFNPLDQQDIRTKIQSLLSLYDAENN